MTPFKMQTNEDIYACGKMELSIKLARAAENIDQRPMGILERVAVFFWFMARSDAEWACIREDLNKMCKRDRYGDFKI